MKGFVKVDGNAVSVAAKRAYNVQKIEDDRMNLVYEGKLKEQELVEQYWATGLAEKDFNEAWDSCAKEVEYSEYVDGWLFRKEVKRKKTTCTLSELDKMLDILKTKHPSWTYRMLSDVFLSKKLGGGVYLPSHYLFRNYFGYSCYADHFKQYFDLKGDVFLTIDEYNRLKEFMDVQTTD